MRSPRRVVVAVIATAVSLSALSAVTPAAGAAPPGATHVASPSPKPVWKKCDSGECAKLTVPLDYDHPDNGKTIKVAMFRSRATDPKHRIGSLVLNFGGPGAPGVEFVRSFKSALPDEIRARFDIVSFDPRGSGDTVPIKCEDDLDKVFSLDYSPDTPDERVALDTGMQQLAQSCEQRSGNILPYVSSLSTVRDMDRIRQAVGDKKLTYVGFSYGTYLGTLYAKLFPNKVRALTLDGAIDPNLSALDVGAQQAQGFERSLEAFLAQCSQNNRCPFYNAGDAAGAFDRLSAQVDAQPIPARKERTLGPGEFFFGVAQALYTGQDGYPQLEQSLAAAQRGDGSRLLSLSDEYTGRHADGSYSSLQDAFWAIGCLDGPSVVGGPDAFQAAEPQYSAAAPRLGVPLLNAGLVCAYWPVPPVPSMTPITVTGTPPILVVGTTGDPATPLQWAEALSTELSSGVLLVAEGTQHTAFVTASNSCVDDAVVKYLVDLTPPAAGTRCA
jgi:pimeloyl-ACP methyl ester carboxylesterase